MKRLSLIKYLITIFCIFFTGLVLADHVIFSNFFSNNLVNNNLKIKNTMNEEGAKVEKCATSSFHYKFQKAELIGEESSLPEETTLIITGLKNNELPALPEDMINVTGDFCGYRMLPHGLVFEQDIVIILPFNQDVLPLGYTPEDIHTFYYDDTLLQWIMISRDSVNYDKKVIVSKVNHFTDFINAVIKLPEMPETQSFTPTSIQAIQAPHPLDGFTLMDPPVANNQGTATLEYPIQVPPGRHGLQPDLTLTYSSSGGSGWVGLGWDLTIPSIEIDTRWGVPRYDSVKESEIYLLHGEQLATKNADGRYQPLAHRSPWVNRMTREVRFYPRTEGAFQKIIRHGDSPKEYWWEVVDKTGIRYFYGKKIDVDSVDTKAVLMDYSGNIARWGLTEIQDSYNNFVHYKYATTSSTDRYLLPDTIYYTGYQKSGTTHEGEYQVVFLRKPKWQMGFSDKTDHGRLGVKEVNNNLLYMIKVLYHNSPVYVYSFCYEVGAYGKTRLKSINQDSGKAVYSCDSNNNNQVKTHVFSYFDAPVSLLAPAQIISTENDLDASWNITPLTRVQVGSLGGYGSSGWSVGGAATIGIGWNIFQKGLSVGGNYTHSENDAHGVVSMIDINGDGLPDKVFKSYSNGQLYFRLQAYNHNLNKYQFGLLQEISGITSFLEDKNTSNGWGLEAHLGWNDIGGAIGYSRNKAIASTKTYFSDVDADGLPDIIQNGQVFFNRLINGRPHFSRSMTDTIWMGGSCSENAYISQGENVNPEIFFHTDTIITCYVINEKTGEMVCDTTFHTEEESFVPQHDAVRRWVAPYKGEVEIFADMCLTEDLQEARYLTPALDGIRFSVQHNQQLLEKKVLVPNDSCCTFKKSPVFVNKGDRIYFRLESLDKRLFDKVKCTPQISYIKCNDYTDLDLSDADGKSLFVFNGGNDFLVNAKRVYQNPTDTTGMIRIESLFSIEEPLSDTVCMKIYKNRTTIFDTLFAKRTVIFNYLKIIEEGVDKGDSIWFELSANTNVNWKAVRWYPKFYFIKTDLEGVVLIDSVWHQPPVYTISYDAIPHLTVFTQPILPTGVFKPNFNTSVRSFSLSLPESGNGKVTFSIKDHQGSLVKREVQLENANARISLNSPIILEKNKSYYIDVYTTDIECVKDVTSASCKFNNDVNSHPMGVHTMHPDSTFIFGAQYRNWGQFTYRKNPDDGDTIVESRLHLSETALQTNASTFENIDPNIFSDSSNVENIDSIFSVNGLYNPLTESFLMMNPDHIGERWCGYGNITYITADTMSNAFTQETTVDETVFPVPISINGEPITAIKKQTFSNNNTLSISIGAIASLGTNYSWGTSEILSDFMDMNGDRFPDVVSKQFIQYSQPQGGLSSLTVPCCHDNIYLDKTTNSGINVSFGASFPMNKRTIANNPKMAHIELGNGCGISGGGGNAQDESQYTWLDINGDGLPDKVKQNGEYWMNIGYGYISPIRFGNSDDLRKNRSVNVGGSIGNMPDPQQFNLFNTSISGGIGFNTSSNQTTVQWMDVNGDGLPDRLVVDEGNVNVQFNTGSGFTNIENLVNQEIIQNNQSLNTSLNVAISVGFTLGCWPIKFIFNPQAFSNNSINNTIGQWMDMNGDGLPDLVSLVDNNTLSIRYNQMGKANLLKSVENVAHGKMFIDYQLSQNNFDCPSRSWNMCSLKIFDGFVGDGVDTLYYTFEYDSAYYDRFEREHLGFKTVKTIQRNISNNTIYRIVTEKFHNREIMRKGLKYYELTTDGQQKKYIEKHFKYLLKEIDTGVEIDSDVSFCYGDGYPALNEEIVNYYEKEPTPQITTRKKYDHGTFGNIIGYHDFGDIADTNDDTYTKIFYFNDPQNQYLVGIPDSVVTFHENTILRKRAAQINPTTGKTEKMTFYNNADVSVYEFKYNTQGNMIVMKFPKNHRQQQMIYHYTYDTSVMTYPVTITDALGYTSSATYNYNYGKIMTATDINHNTIRYAYDNLGRLEKITAPYEYNGTNSCYTIKYQYWIDITRVTPEALSKIPWASTLLYDPNDPNNPNNPLTTVVFSDASGKIIQTKKDIEIVGIERRSISGHIKYDAFGRAVKRYYPVVENNEDATLTTVNTIIDNTPPTIYTYDELDRVLSEKDPLQHTSFYTYAFGNDAFSKKRFKMQIKDPLERMTTIFTDPRGMKTSITTSPLVTTTKFTYNALGETICTTDPNEHNTEYQYDLLGRLIQRTHPDAGTTSRRYDPAGNLTALKTQKLAINDDSIQYHYTYNRLDSIVYPDNTENNVRYTYGTPTDIQYNQAGRLKIVEDITGFTEFRYGALGEITQERRTLILPLEDYPYSFTHRFSYDSHNRIKSMTYPDGDSITYFYDKGGNLKQVKSIYNGNTSSIVKNINYNKFEARTDILYGNNIKTYYWYDQLQRLSRLKTTYQNNAMQELIYSYDTVSNITQIQNNGNIIATLGGSYTYNYSYDALNRMTQSNGSFYGYDDTITYALEMTYAEDGRITRKNQNVVFSDSLQQRNDLTYNRPYNYLTTQPHTIQHFGSNKKDLQWDENGNVQWEKINNRTLCYDEENRLTAVAGTDYGSLYLYNHAGERTLKMTGVMTRMTINGSVTYRANIVNTTLYVSPYTTANNTNLSKHYYAGTERLMTRTGRGTIANINDHLATAPDLTAKRFASRQLIQRTVNTCLNKTFTYQSNKLTYLRQNPTPSYATFYYHTDHLGSSAWITKANGAPQQYLTYLPFGETLYEKRANTTWNSLFTFSGKERDNETGYAYFGARYYSSNYGIWLSIDPMSDKYPAYSPYNYNLNNPIRLIDPDGRDPIYAKNFWGKVKLIGDDGKNSTGSYLVRSSVAREVKRATKAGKFYIGDLSENKKVMHIPTGQKLEGVKQSYEDTKISQKENGGHANIGDANVTRWDEGPAAISFTDKDGNQGAKASLQMFVVNGKNTMPTDASNVEMWWHTHPNTTVNGISLGNSTPSDADYSGQKTMTNRGYKGNTFVIGVRSGTVTFFNKDGILTTVKWTNFLRMGGQKE